MRVIIAGTRRIWSFQVIRDAIKEAGFEVTTIISGGAPGIDTAAIDVALVDGYDLEIYDADWDKYGNQAGPIRNRVMRDKKPDGLIALPIAESIGTRDMIKLMAGLPTYVKEL